MSERVRLEGRDLSIPRVQGKKDVFGSPLFFFLKPSWALDHDVIMCPLCQSTFTQLKRRHHCRNCGHIFCSKCCCRKVPLPQFGLDEPQRICEACREIVELVAKSRSEYVAHRREAAVGLLAMMETLDGQVKLIELGGLQTLISITSQGDDSIKRSVAAGVHTLAQHLPLHNTLVETGCIKAIAYILTSMASRDEATTLHALHAIKLFSSNRETVPKVLEECKIGVLEPLLLCSGTVSLLAAGILCVLSENQETHLYLTKENPLLLPRLVQSLSSDDVQMREICLKILVHFTAGNEDCREQVLLEDVAYDRPLMKLLNPNMAKAAGRVLGNTVCLVANLAASRQLQGKLQPYIAIFTLLLEERGRELDIITVTNISRGLANFAEFSINGLLLINHLPLILSTLMLSHVEIHRIHAARLVVSLLTTEPVATLERLTENGAESFLETILSLPGMSEMLTTLLLRKGSRLSVTLG